MMQKTTIPTIVLSIVLSISLTGCMTTRVEESKNTATGILIDESIVILEASYHAGNETEDEFVDCVSKKVQKGRHGLNVYPDEKFIDTMFPWFEPRTMPRKPEALPALFERPGLTERLEASGVRYIIWGDGRYREIGQRRQPVVRYFAGRWRLLRSCLVGR